MEPVKDQPNPIADQLSIDTPELVSIEMPLAGIGSRFIATFIDYSIWTFVLVLSVTLGALLLPGMTIMSRISVNWGIGLILLLLFLFHWGYFTLFEALWNGRTPGKHVTHIRVIHRSGRAINFVESLARNLLRFIDYLPSLYAVGLITIFLSRQNQRLGDMVAGTLVVHDREVDTPYWGELGSRTITAASFAETHPAGIHMAPRLAVMLPASLVARLSAADLEVLEGFFARRLDMSLSTRAALAERLSAAIRSKTGLAIPNGIST